MSKRRVGLGEGSAPRAAGRKVKRSSGAIMAAGGLRLSWLAVRVRVGVGVRVRVRVRVRVGVSQLSP